MKILLKDTSGEIHTIADSAAGRSGQPWFIPDFGENWQWRKAVALRVSRLGKEIASRYANRYYDAATLIWVAEASGCNALDYMDGRIVVGRWLPVEKVGESIAAVEALLVDASHYATLKTGDVVALELSGEAEPIVAPTTMIFELGGEEVLKFNIR